MLDAIALELVPIGSAEDLVAGDLGGDDLCDDVLVGEADDKTVFGCVVFIFGLRDQALAGEVVGFTCPSTLWLWSVRLNTSAPCEEGFTLYLTWKREKYGLLCAASVMPFPYPFSTVRYLLVLLERHDCDCPFAVE